MFRWHVPDGFLGTRADAFFDVTVIALFAIGAVLVYSIRLARAKRIRAHRAMMLTMLVALTLLLVLFETHLRTSGGPRILFRQSSLFGTATMVIIVYTHVFLAVATVGIWTVQGLLALVLYQRSLPGRFSQPHRVLGMLVCYGFLSVAVTALMVYIVGFVV